MRPRFTAPGVWPQLNARAPRSSYSPSKTFTGYALTPAAKTVKPVATTPRSTSVLTARYAAAWRETTATVANVLKYASYGLSVLSLALTALAARPNYPFASLATLGAPDLIGRIALGVHGRRIDARARSLGEVVF